MKFKHASQKGFTLVELIVSLGLFTIVVVAVVTSLYTVNAAYKRVSAMREVLDNLNFAIESVVRNVHTGTEIVCGGERFRPIAGGTGVNCSITTPSSGGSNTISLKSTLGERGVVQYSLEGNSIVRKEASITKGQNGVDMVGGLSNPGIQLTAPQITVQRLTFYVDGAQANDGQPRIVMFMQGIAKASEKNVQPFAIQTYISQRSFE